MRGVCDYKSVIGVRILTPTKMTSFIGASSGSVLENIATDNLETPAGYSELPFFQVRPWHLELLF